MNNPLYLGVRINVGLNLASFTTWITGVLKYE